MIKRTARDMPHFFSTRLRKTLAWLALGAMCFGAAAPTVTKWLAWAAQTQDLIQICDGTGHGTLLVPAAQLQAQGQPPQDFGAGHQHGGQPGSQDEGCAYCALVHHWPWVPVAATVFAPPAPQQAMRYAQARVEAPALRPWHRPQMPQAPPAA